jgi:MOSC domain-containing protein YiiM
VNGLTGEVLSVQVGRAGVLPWRGREVVSAIVKTDMGRARVALGRDGLAGDEPGGRRLHGGPDKAVCCYPSEHLPEWSALLHRELPHGAFGENLTLRGLTEQAVHIGDTYTLGSSVVQVSQPRGPCFKIAARWGARMLPNQLAQGLKAGFYLRVLEPGDVGAGDLMSLVDRASAVTVAEVLRVSYRDRHDEAAVQAVVAVPELAPQWRDGLASRPARRPGA